jgi:hypothetical protein
MWCALLAVQRIMGIILLDIIDALCYFADLLSLSSIFCSSDD